MNNSLFEQAKQAVAEKRNCEDWDFMIAAYEGVEAFMPEEWLSETVNGAWQEAAELYAQWCANEAVKAEDVDAKLKPDYDGQFLGFFVQKQECGTIWKYWRIVHCEFNVWKLEQNERMICWRQLPPEPKGKLKMLDSLPFPQQPDGK